MACSREAPSEPPPEQQQKRRARRLAPSTLARRLPPPKPPQFAHCGAVTVCTLFLVPAIGRSSGGRISRSGRAAPFSPRARHRFRIENAPHMPTTRPKVANSNSSTGRPRHTRVLASSHASQLQQA
ncbi:hypothetical protein MTO96_004258 [Rhipicephalus appendiculatus]